MSLFNFDYRNTRLVVAGAVLAVAGGVLGGGCGPSGLDYPTVQDFCQGVAAVDCSGAAVSACYGANAQTIDADTETCIGVRSRPELCNPSNLPYHAEFADGCVDAHAALYSSAQLDPTLYQQMQQACLQVFNNGGTTGTHCTSDANCDVGDGFSCLVHGSASQGSCQIPVSTMAGEDCSSPAALCTDSTGTAGAFYCEAAPSGNHCIADPGMGQACGPSIPCAAGLRCGGSVCGPQAADGKPCMVNSDCTGGFCVLTMGDSGVCAGEMTLAFASPTCNAFLGE
jgi:hypothetical protein